MDFTGESNNNQGCQKGRLRMKISIQMSILSICLWTSSKCSPASSFIPQTEFYPQMVFTVRGHSKNCVCTNAWTRLPTWWRCVRTDAPRLRKRRSLRARIRVDLWYIVALLLGGSLFLILSRIISYKQQRSKNGLLLY